MKRRFYSIFGAVTFLLLASCAPLAQSPAPTPDKGIESDSQTQQPDPTHAATMVYGLKLDGELYEIRADFLPDGLFGEEEAVQLPEEVPFPAGWRYEADGLNAQTFTEEGGGQSLISLTTWKEGETPEGIGIGSALEELKSAYPGRLIYHDGAQGNGTEPVNYDRVYSCFQPDDGTNCLYEFYLWEKQVVMITVRDGLDASREWGSERVPVLGDERIRWEVQGDTTRYFVEWEDGTEETILELQGTVESRDLDGDGVEELLVFLPGASKALGIYDKTENGLIYTDVSQTLECEWSDFMGMIANLTNREYRNCIRAGDGEKDGVYSYSDGQLTYECSFQEAMGW